MLKNLFDFKVKRNLSQAVIFYIFYLLAGILLSFILTKIILIIYPTGDELYLQRIIAALYAVVLFFMIYIQKKSNSILYLIIGITLGTITTYFGLITSIIFVAILTTTPEPFKGVPIVENNSCHSCKEIHDNDNE